MNVLLTGATGYIGRHFLRELAARGHTITAATSDFGSLQAKLSTLGASLSVTQRISWEQLDFADSPELLRPQIIKLLTKHKIDAVLNNAGIHLEEEGNTFARINYETPRVLADVINETLQIRRFIHISTITAGSDQAKQHPETYAGSKRQAEDYMQSLPSMWARTTIIRPITVYDPEAQERPGHPPWLASFDPTPVLGSGNQQLQPIYVRDLVKAAGFIEDGGKNSSRIYEAVGSEITTISDWISVIKRGRNQPYTPIYIPYPVAEVITRHWQIGSISQTMVGVWKAREEGYRPYDHRPFADAIAPSQLTGIEQAYCNAPIVSSDTRFLAGLFANQDIVKAVIADLAKLGDAGVAYGEILHALAQGESPTMRQLSAISASSALRSSGRAESPFPEAARPLVA